MLHASALEGSESRPPNTLPRLRSVRNIRVMPLSGGQTFAGYRIVRLLGSGGMGEDAPMQRQAPALVAVNRLEVLGRARG